ncbi:DUF3667 domain-containing protein [Luteimonas sp. BDR2-5]|uniref:DUF3667 domain-containing protein n=1 Tax=Proluteimonas luteida TaxID=2878685 RepID=UPI001E50C613|nr:DUF3667 domain-containing protein [Luteimonas sp. BDR2-5]MCD9027336.1 DUF3667 domain-containing protein [Luteimonas sp. BDR2-5]
MSHASATDAAPATCENCATPLQGEFCYHCGQSTHSPVRHVGHAVEEVFESFWHLDGRIFRTVRDLFVPGRIANRYLAGHRVRYVAPMRLFVILTVLTFFVARFLVDDSLVDLAANSIDPDTQQRIEQALTAAEVAAVRDEVLADLDETRRVAGAIPGVRPQLEEAETLVRQQAQARIDALAPGADLGADPQPEAGRAAGAPTQSPTGTDPTPAVRAKEPPTIGGPLGERVESNVLRGRDNPEVVVRALLGAAPTTLFILVPLFAVLLKLFYVFQRRLYLEHVVIALYSHAALMLGLLLVFCCALAGGWLAPRVAWAAHALGWLQSLLLVAMPVYLLLMQKRVYGQSWPMTLLKFAVIGNFYLVLFLSVAGPTAFYALYAL